MPAPGEQKMLALPFSIELRGCRNFALKSLRGSAGMLPALAGMLLASIARTLLGFRALVS